MLLFTTDVAVEVRKKATIRCAGGILTLFWAKLRIRHSYVAARRRIQTL